LLLLGRGVDLLFRFLFLLVDPGVDLLFRLLLRLVGLLLNLAFCLEISCCVDFCSWLRSLSRSAWSLWAGLLRLTATSMGPFDPDPNPSVIVS
jgi:hypothetical protein